MKNIAKLDWSLDIQCPNCEHVFDISNSGNDDEGEITTKIFNNKWDDIKGYRIICPDCDKVFLIDEVIY